MKKIMLTQKEIVRCRRCGRKLEKKSDLWCKDCRELVDKELKGEIDKPLIYFFKHYKKRN